jgi:hypothetical protein
MSGVSAPIYLNTEDGKFDGWIGTECFNGDNIVEVRRAIRETLDERQGFELQHILEISMPRQGYYARETEPKHGYFGFDLEDYWVSVDPVGKEGLYLINQSKYSIADPDEKMERLRIDALPWRQWKDAHGGGEFKPPCYLNNYIWIPYSKEAVEALEHLKGQVDVIRDNFVEFVNSATGLEKMNEIGAQLMAALPAPEED